MPLKQLAVAFFLLINCLSAHLFAQEQEYALTGKVGRQPLDVRYQPGSKELQVRVENRSFSIALSGYTVKDLLVYDLDLNGVDEVIFLDLAGVSAGGELRILSWNGRQFEEPTEEYSANSIKVERVKGGSYILLLQHDTEGLYSVSNALMLKSNHLYESDSEDVWREVIGRYIEQIEESKENWERSRYFSYISLAYDKLREIYLEKAKELDANNPFLSR